MTPLRSREVAAFSTALERIHMATDLAQFPERVFEVFEELMPGSVLTIDEFNTAAGTGRNAINRPPSDLAGWRQQLSELAPTQHPVFPSGQAGARSPMRVSDFISDRQFRRTDFYHEIFCPIGVRHQIVIPLIVPGHIAGLTISRWKDFSDEEFCLARLLAPHLALAHIHAQHFTALRAAQGEAVPTPEALARLGLTPRESEALHWIIQGKRNGEIAEILNSSVRTVEKHVQHVFAKLCVETRTAAALEAVRLSIAHARLPT